MGSPAFLPRTSSHLRRFPWPRDLPLEAPQQLIPPQIRPTPEWIAMLFVIQAFWLD